MNNIKAHLAKLSIKQQAFAEKVGIHPATLNGYLNEHRIPNVDVAWNIVKGMRELGSDCQFEDVFPPNSYRKTARKRQLAKTKRSKKS